MIKYLLVYARWYKLGTFIALDCLKSMVSHADDLHVYCSVIIWLATSSSRSILLFYISFVSWSFSPRTADTQTRMLTRFRAYLLPPPHG